MGVTISSDDNSSSSIWSSTWSWSTKPEVELGSLKGKVSAWGATPAQNDIFLFVDLISNNASDDRSSFADTLVNRLDLTTMKWSTEET